MTKSQLDKKLDKALQDFSNQMRTTYPEDDFSPATKSDISECSRQVFYLMDDFRKSISEYLKSPD